MDFFKVAQQEDSEFFPGKTAHRSVSDFSQRFTGDRQNDEVIMLKDQLSQEVLRDLITEFMADPVSAPFLAPFL